MSRVIVYAEVPSFYAEVERAADAALAGRPVLVGGDPRKRGLVQSASREALDAGVELDMPVLDALARCPRARALRTDMPSYRDASRRLFACLRRGFDRLEPVGLDAAYFDVSAESDPPEDIAGRLRDAVKRELGLPLRVGIASGKFLARLAAREAGERGILRLEPGAEVAFLAPLPVARLDGVGRRTEAALAELGARTVGDVAALGPEALEAALGTHGLRIHAYATGAEDARVNAAAHPKSLSREATLGLAELDRVALEEAMLDLAQRLEAELRLQGLVTARVSLRLRFRDGGSVSRSQTLHAPILAAADLRRVAAALLDRIPAGSRAVRGLGIQLAALAPSAGADRQLELFTPGR